MQEQNGYPRKIICLFWAFLILFSQPAAAIEQGEQQNESAEQQLVLQFQQNTSDPQQNPQSSPPVVVQFPANPAPIQQPPQITSIPLRATISCRLSELPAEQSQKLKEELYVNPKDKETGKPGAFEGGEINSGTEKIPVEEREKLHQKTILIPTQKEGEAVPKEITVEKFSAKEATDVINHGISGPFAVGIVLSDTVRIGRCRNTKNQEYPCYLKAETGLLDHRNEGEGITSNASLVGKEAKDIITGWITGEKQTPPYFSQGQQEALASNAAMEDLDTLTIKTLKRNKKLVPNVLEAERFNASMATTCSSAGCTISIYSAFDKYFNAWFSAELVISNFGPTLIGQGKRYAGWLVRRGWPWDIGESRFLNWIRRNFGTPDTLYGSVRIKNINERWFKYGLSDWRNDLMEPSGSWTSGYKVIKSGSFREWWSEVSKAGGRLDEIKDPVMKGEFFKNIRDLRGYMRARAAVFDYHKAAYDKIASRFGLGSAEEIAARIDYGKNTAKLMIQIDNDFALDIPEWWARDEFAGIYDKAVYNTGTKKFVNVAGDSAHIRHIANEFISNGNWNNWRGVANTGVYNVSQNGNILFYRIKDDARLIDSIRVEDLRKNFSRLKDKAVEIPELGEKVILDDATIDYITENATGTVKVYEADWGSPIEVDPYTFAQKLTHHRMPGRASRNLLENSKAMYDTLVEKNFAGLSRRYYSALDKAFAQEENLLKTYFRLKGGLKYTALPYMYWYGKKGIVGGQTGEKISAFQLPDSWTKVDIVPREQPIYNNAYIDFFANGGSDTGDIFVQVLNHLPWKMVLNAASDQFGPFQVFDDLTGRGMRSKTENLAFFAHTEENCAGCSLVSRNTTLQDIEQSGGKINTELGASAKGKVNAYLVEDTSKETLEKEGQALISFTHATNLEGTSQGQEPIDLVKAIKDGKTCEEAVKSIGLGWVGSPSRAGLVLSGVESAGYFVFGWAGIVGTAIQQTLFANKLQDCVDHIEGYYIHFFEPEQKQKQKAASPQEKATEKVGQIVKNFAGEEKKAEQEKEKNFIEQGIDKIIGETKERAQKEEAKDIVQALVLMEGSPSGKLLTNQFFFFWFKGTAVPASYDKESKIIVEDKKTGTKILQDNKQGYIAVVLPDGTTKKIIEPIEESRQGKPKDKLYTAEDHTRMVSADGRVPARKIPQRITGIGLRTDSAETIMAMNLDSSIIVYDASILDCIKQGVLEQTGVPLRSNDLSEVFGTANFVSTTTHSNIHADRQSSTIFAEGAERKTLSDPNALAEIKMNAQVELSAGTQRTSVGRLNSIRFQNGVMLYKPESHELLMHLQFNEKAVLPARFVSGLQASPTTVTNPETNCSEPAINLEAIPITGSDKAAENVKNFNDSVAKQGPFQVFDTDNKRIIFYSVLENGECVNKVRIIDKKTGNVLVDDRILGNLEKTPTGVKFTTADGKQHTIDFSAENGVPKVSIDGSTPETLRRAQGPNGSFWYDPETGLYYPENSQLVPLLEAFKQQGFGKQVAPDGSVPTRPGGSPLNITIGGAQQTPFNLPSLPENPIVLLLFIISIAGAISVSRIIIEKRIRRGT